MNKIIKLLMLSDVLIITGFGLIAPILAIFIKENLIGGTIFAAGLASTIFLVVKSIIQLPFSKYIDSQKQKVRWIIIGTFLISLVPFIYIFSKSIYHIFIAQVIYGIGAALAYPTWLGLWSTHLDKKHESFEWGLYSTLTGLVAAGTAAIGAAIAQYIGFTYTFLFVGIMSLVGMSILFKLLKEDIKQGKSKTIQHYKKRKLIHKNYIH